MTAYDLSRLNDKEFEEFAMQMIGRLSGRKVERFKSGKDHGVDGRFFTVGQKECVVQAKHWNRAAAKPLQSYLARKEVAKVEALKPARYIVITSVALARTDKQKIKEAFTPYILSETDIYGYEDIQDFLRDHEEIARQHYKLWLASSEVLSFVANAAIFGRSAFKMTEILAFQPKYVRTHCHDDALARLDTNHAIILIGEPGIGKSTLAEQLVVHFAMNGYQLYMVDRDLTEAETAWKNDQKQAFYFDDFLGTNYLEGIEQNLDSKVCHFMRRVQNDPLKRFVLTSRTTILQQGKSLSEAFRIHKIEQQAYEVRVANLTGMEKATILYNQIWFGSLTPEFIEELYLDKRYLKIIEHRNFNPRLIEFITDSTRQHDRTPAEYWQYVTDTLENPQDVWRGVFENQLSPMGRLIVSLVTFNGAPLDEEALRAAVERARKEAIPQPSVAEWNLDFRRTLEMMVGAVIRRTMDSKSRRADIRLFNPSVGDFVFKRFADDAGSIATFLAFLQDEMPLLQLDALRRSKFVSEEVFVRVMTSLVRRFLREPLQAPEFVSLLAALAVDEPGVISEVNPELRNLANSFFALAATNSTPANLVAFGVYVVEQELLPRDDQRWLGFVEGIVEESGSDDDLIDLAKLAALLEGEVHDDATQQIYEHVLTSWKEHLYTLVSESNVADYASDEDDDRAREEIRAFIKKSLNKYPIHFDWHDIDAIMEDFSVSDHIRSNRRHYSPSGLSGSPSSKLGISHEEYQRIHDLFDRERQ